MSFQPKELLHAAYSIEDKLRDLRRDFHRHPELGFNEFRTTKRIREELALLPDIEIHDIDFPTGVVAELPGRDSTAGTVGLRCDIDALEIQEQNTHCYVSETPGLMHACGHDGHIATLLGAAMLLSKFQRPERSVRFLFQPAEECTPDGAPGFIATGALDGLDAVFGFHLNATSDFGNVGWYDGAVMSGTVGCRITITGKKGHPAYPEACINPIGILARILIELDGIKQTIRATRPYLFAPGSFQSGEEMGTSTPETAVLTLRVAFLEEEVRGQILERIETIAHSIATIYGAKAEIEYEEVFPITYNEPELGTTVRECAKSLGLQQEEIFPSMGSDDFAYYVEKVPAYYMTFGIRKGENFSIAHTPRFDFDEAILPIAAAEFAACALHLPLKK